MRERSTFRAYVELTKPRIGLMVVVTAAFGYFLAGGGIDQPLLLACTLLGTVLAGGGSSALNQYLEREVDGAMDRTRNRPLPTGQISPQSALLFGVALVLAGCFLLLWQVNLLTAFLALQSSFLYVLVYTPMKRLSWINTTIGAIPGAMPPLGGWAAATGGLDVGAWALFAVLFIWQHPHFFAIAWMFRDDYRRGGFQMLSVVDPSGARLFRQTLVFSVVLVPVSLAPALLGSTHGLYAVGAAALGVMMLYASIAFVRQRDFGSARQLMRASLIYLPALLLLIVADTIVF